MRMLSRSGVLLTVLAGSAVALATLSNGDRAAADFSTQAVMQPREKILYSFHNLPDGIGPVGPLLPDASGALYGTTSAGGTKCNLSAFGCGTVFRLAATPSGYTESILYAFQGGQDGLSPGASVIGDASGALYGTTSEGGSSIACADIVQNTGCGTVFQLVPSGPGYAERVIYRFSGGADGAYPRGNLIEDDSGALFGTTYLGGSRLCHQLHLRGCGTVYKLTPHGSGYTFETIYSFVGGDSDGARPDAALLAGAGGALYGTTENGANGTVFKLSPSGSAYVESILFRFTKLRQGAQPISALISDTAGGLYGTTLSGPKAPGCSVGSREIGCGTVFKLIPSSSGYHETILYYFQGGSDGFAPTAGLVFGKDGRLYGSTVGGGGGAGTIYELAPTKSGYRETVLVRFTDNFQRNGGTFPSTSLIVGNGDRLLGTAGGGHHCIHVGGCGVVFSVHP
jgi:uncharacterized repeat protein (TIGR03803 family)